MWAAGRPPQLQAFTRTTLPIQLLLAGNIRSAAQAAPIIRSPRRGGDHAETAAVIASVRATWPPRHTPRSQRRAFDCHSLPTGSSASEALAP